MSINMDFNSSTILPLSSSSLRVRDDAPSESSYSSAPMDISSGSSVDASPAAAPSPIPSESSHGSAPMDISSGSSVDASPVAAAPSPIPSESSHGSCSMSISSSSSFVPAPAISSRISGPSLVTSEISASNPPPSEDSSSISRCLATLPCTFAHSEAAPQSLCQPAAVQLPRYSAHVDFVAQSDNQPATVYSCCSSASTEATPLSASQATHLARNSAHVEVVAQSDSRPSAVSPPVQKNLSSVTANNSPSDLNTVMSEDSADMEPTQRPRWQDTPPMNPHMPATDPTFSGWGFAADEDRIQASEDLLLAEMAKNHNDPPYHWTNDDEIDHLSLDDIDDLFHEMETGKKADPKRKPASSVERPTKRVKNNNASKAMTASTSAAAIPPTTNKAEPTTAMLEPATTEPTPKSGKRRRKSRKSAAAPEATRTLRSSTTKTAESAAPAPIPAEAQVPAPGPSKLLPESWAVAMDEDKLLSMMKDQGHTWAEIIEMWTENSEMDYTQCSLKRRWGHLKKELGRWAGFDEALVAAVERTKTPDEESWERVAESVSEEVSLAITGQLCKSRFEALEKEKVAQ